MNGVESSDSNGAVLVEEAAQKISLAPETNGHEARRLEGKVALITGAASGLGKATAEEFIRQGAIVIIADIDPQLGKKAAEELGPRAHFLRCDITDESQVSDAVDAAVALHGRLDIMFNNAGLLGGSTAGISELDLGEFDRFININLRGTLAGIKHASRAMIPNGSGSILCTGSISGLIGGTGPHGYSISKNAIVGTVRSLAGELGRHGIRINCVSPGVVATENMIESFGKLAPGLGEEELRGLINSWSELNGAACEPKDVARAALYLASDEAKYVTGHNLVVDGGFTCFKDLRFKAPGGS